MMMWQRVAVQRGGRVYPYARRGGRHGHDGGEVLRRLGRRVRALVNTGQLKAASVASAKKE